MESNKTYKTEALCNNCGWTGTMQINKGQSKRKKDITLHEAAQAGVGLK